MRRASGNPGGKGIATDGGHLSGLPQRKGRFASPGVRNAHVQGVLHKIVEARKIPAGEVFQVWDSQAGHGTEPLGAGSLFQLLHEILT
jgi:hypothetical protein